ncbi:MAG TPA: YicC/YloC family endoribonuclease [Thermoanaerobaculia bacterium]|nr:YicC/YloC family endoribonuclease [Thermoanaerobaculia bacterium]
MIRSMTGFGRARRNLSPETSAELVVRSVNHRFLDLTIKLRETEGALEPVLRKVFSRSLSRGKVEVALKVRKTGEVVHEITVNEGLLEAVLRRFTELSSKYPVSGSLEARDVLAIPQIFSVENGGGEFSPEEIGEVEGLAEEAAAALIAMRESEGAAVAADLASRIGFLQKKVGEISSRREEITRNLFETLRARVQALFPQVPLDSGRIEQEAALAADRSDVSEELQRLEAHLSQFASLVASSTEPVGKRLDFLTQEILREMNTLGSKARDLQLTREVLEMKSEIEKIREQVQNVE